MVGHGRLSFSRQLGQVSACTFTIGGSGAGISGTTNAFRFVSQTLSGDGTIVARLASEFNVVGTAKAGVMIRDGLAFRS
jgi:hypothetical protein